MLTAINRHAWIDPHYHIAGLNWLPRPLAEAIIAWRGRSKTGAAFRDMQRLSEMHYFRWSEWLQLCQQKGFQVRDLREELLREGKLNSPKRSRRAIRSLLRTMGLEQFAYRLQRRWYVGMFEVALELTKDERRRTKADDGRLTTDD
jgi:hypothetical protein